MTQRHSILLLLILALFAAAGMLRLNDLSLYTDSTRYVIWAESLSRGLGWLDDTQPLPEAYVVNAPFYPLLLIPSQWIAGASLTAAKVLTLAYGLGALALLCFWLRRLFTPAAALALTGLVAATPLTLVMFTEALSEAPFFLLVFLVLLLRDRVLNRELTRGETTVTVAALAFLPLLREASIALVAAFLLDAVVRKQRRIAALTAVGVISIVGLWTVRNMVWVGVPESSQSTNIQFVFEHFVTPASAPLWQEWVERIIINIRSYRYELTGMVLVPFPLNLIREPSSLFVLVVDALNVVKSWVGVIFLPLIGIGLWVDVRRSSSGVLRALFLLFYATIILLYPLQDIRFFLPALPFLIVLIARGLETAVAPLKRGRMVVLTILAVFLAGLNLSSVVELLRSNLQYRTAVSEHRSGKASFQASGYYATPWELAGEALAAATPANAVVASAAKEIVPFVGGRKVLEVNRAVPLPMFESMLREHDVSVLLVQQVRSGVRSHEIQITESRRFRFDTIGVAGWLTVYRVRNLAREGLPPAPSIAVARGEGVLGLLHEGRAAIRELRPAEADSLLLLAKTLDPVNAEVAYQRVAAASLGGTLQQAVTAQQELFSTPRSTSYSPPGRALLALAQFLDAARSLRGTARAQALFQASRSAWDLGYFRHAVAFADSALIADPEHFEALLWSTHYGFQMSDVPKARGRLRVLTRLERTNPVVVGFREIDSLLSSLSTVRNDQKQADIFLEASKIYERIGLPEEALDLADRAWQDRLGEARRRTAEILAATGREAGAERYRGKN